MFVSGHYAATLNGTSLDDTEQGWELLESHLVEDIITDTGGDAPVDGIQRGSRMELRCTYTEYDKIIAALYAANPQGKAFSNVGKLITNLAGILVLTPTAGTAAATILGTGNSYIFHRAIVLTDIVSLLSTRHSKGPITFRCYPSVATPGEVYTIGAAGGATS